MLMLKPILKKLGCLTPNCNFSRDMVGRMAVRDRFIDIQDAISNDSPIILECGASNGPMIEKYLALFENPKVYAFEPQPGFVKILKKKFRTNKNIKIIDKAVGAESRKLRFHVLTRPTSSSFLTPTSLNCHYHPKEMGLRKSIEVEQVRLDEVIKENSIDVLKLDLQGYELEALKGAGGILRKIKTITTEVEFVKLYENQSLFGDIDLFLRENGFRLFNLYELYTQDDGQLTAGDALYFNTEFF